MDIIDIAQRVIIGNAEQDDDSKMAEYIIRMKHNYSNRILIPPPSQLMASFFISKYLGLDIETIARRVIDNHHEQDDVIIIAEYIIYENKAYKKMMLDALQRLQSALGNHPA